MRRTTEWREIGANIKVQALVLLGFVALIWGVEIIDQLTGPWLMLDTWGIRPRSWDGLRGIFLAPFLHGNLAHVATNTFPFLIFGGLIMLQRPSNFWAVSFITAFLSGLGIWLVGAGNSIHIGASGLVFGYFGFLLTLGYFERRVETIIQSLVIGFLYGGLIWGVLPIVPGVSWEGHLFGFLAGILTAYLLADRHNIGDEITIHHQDARNTTL